VGAKAYPMICQSALGRGISLNSIAVCGLTSAGAPVAARSKNKARGDNYKAKDRPWAVLRSSIVVAVRRSAPLIFRDRP
jgi:hypothetical protein